MHLLHCTLLWYIKSYIEDPSHEFFISRYFVHNRFIDLGNQLEVVVYYSLIEGMDGLGY